MKKNAIRILSLLLVVMTLVGVISLPVSAYSYPMNYTIAYKTKDGKTLGTNSGQVDAEATVREALRVTSPSYDGYVLSDSNDSVVRKGKVIMEETLMLETKNLGISFGGLKAAQDVNLRIKKMNSTV